MTSAAVHEHLQSCESESLRKKPSRVSHSRVRRPSSILLLLLSPIAIITIMAVQHNSWWSSAPEIFMGIAFVCQLLTPRDTEVG